MPRFANVKWELPSKRDGYIETWDLARLAVLMDIRDELQKLNALLGCRNFVAVPGILRDIRSRRCHRRHAPRKK